MSEEEELKFDDIKINPDYNFDSDFELDLSNLGDLNLK